jgi:hypothetical protein
VRVRSVLAVAVAAVLVAAGSATAARPDPSPGPAAFVNPPFAKHCRVHHFKEGVAPDLNGYPEDPLCVEYQKRDITADNGGAAAFLLAEPARFAIALPKCKYWQQDHWRVQLDSKDEHIVGWDGSYWFDKGTGRAGAILRNFSVEGHPADPGAVADLVQQVSPLLAEVMRSHGASGAFGTAFDPRCPH